MRVNRQAARKPRYPAKSRFLALFGAGLLAGTASAADAPRLAGKPAPVQPDTQEVARLRGRIAPVLPGLPPPPTNACPPAATNTVAYVIQKGDTLTGIAKAQLGDAARWTEIQALNPGVKAESLAVGAVLLLPVTVVLPNVPVQMHLKGVMRAPDADQ